MIPKVISVVLLAVIGGSYGQNVCPPPEEITPCKCYGIAAAYLRCTGMMNTDDLVRVIRRSSVRYYASVDIIESAMLHLPLELFNNFHTDRLRIRNTTLTTLFPEIPPENQLQDLRIEDSVIQSTVQWYLLERMKGLVSFTMINSPIRSISHAFGAYVPSAKLQQITFENVGVSQVTRGAFVSFRRLKEINLSRNKIKYMERSWFPNPSTISKINLKSNRLTSIPKGAFENMPLLRNISLGLNNLTTISEDIFGNTPPTKITIELRGNQIECNCDIQWMVKYLEQGSHFVGTCHTAGEQREIELHKLTADDFSCP